MGTILGSSVFLLTGLGLAVVSLLQFMEKGYLFNYEYMWASPEKRATMDKKARYRQAGTVLAGMAATAILLGLHSLLELYALMYCAYCLIYLVIMYSFLASSNRRRIERENLEKTAKGGNTVFKEKFRSSDRRRVEELLGACLDKLILALGTTVPETGSFRYDRYTFNISGTRNKAVFSVEPRLSGEPDQRMLHLGVYREGTDILVSNYMRSGTNAELLAYLQAPESREEWLNAIFRLSERVDDKF